MTKVRILHDTPIKVGNHTGCVYITYLDTDRTVRYHSVNENSMETIRKLFQYVEDDMLVSPTDKEYSALMDIITKG